jgi:hypothetical protein
VLSAGRHTTGKMMLDAKRIDRNLMERISEQVELN